MRNDDCRVKVGLDCGLAETGEVIETDEFRKEADVNCVEPDAVVEPPDATTIRGLARPFPVFSLLCFSASAAGESMVLSSSRASSSGFARRSTESWRRCIGNCTDCTDWTDWPPCQLGNAASAWPCCMATECMGSGIEPLKLGEGIVGKGKVFKGPAGAYGQLRPPLTAIGSIEMPDDGDKRYEGRGIMKPRGAPMPVPSSAKSSAVLAAGQTGRLPTTLLSTFLESAGSLALTHWQHSK